MTRYCAALSWMISAILSVTTAASEHPNIVVILADDLGYGDVHALNPDSRIPTPHLDRLAADGMTFTDARFSALCLHWRWANHGIPKAGTTSRQISQVFAPG